MSLFGEGANAKPNSQGDSNKATGKRSRAAKGERAAKAKTERVAKEPKTPLAKLAETEAAEKAKTSPQATGEIHTVPMDRITFGLNPRTYFDLTGIDELAESIKANGGQPMQPPTVRPIGNGMYQMIAGERRWRAMRALGKREINVIVRNASDEEAEKLALTENIARHDMLPGDTGRAYQALKNNGMSLEEIAQTAGKSVQSVRDHLALVETLEPHLQKLVDTAAKEGRGKGIPMSLVGPLSQLNAQHREQVAERIMAPKGMSVQAAKTLISVLKQKEGPSLFGPTEHTPRTKAAHEKFSAGIEGLVKVLSGLDNDTIEHAMAAVTNPLGDQQRVHAAILQLQRIEATLGRHVAVGEAAGM